MIRLMKVLTATWLVCCALGWGCHKMMPQLIAPGTPPEAVIFNDLIALGLWGLMLVGGPVLALGWIVAFFVWLTRPSKPDFTPREIQSRIQPKPRYDAGHRWLG